MKVTIFQDALNLNEHDRMELASQLWDSLTPSDPEIRLSPAQWAELSRRLKRFQENGTRGDSWPAVKARIVRSH